MKSKFLRVFAVLLALAMLAAACGDDDDTTSSGDDGAGSTDDGGDGGDGDTDDGGDAPSGEPIVFGMDLDSTGPGASYSTIAGDTVRDAVDELNENGGILGRPVELVVENDESDPTKTPSVIRKLLDRNADVLILQTASAATIQAKPIIQEAQKPALAPTSISQTLAEQPDGDFTYVLANPISDFIEVYCGGYEAAGIETLAVMSDATTTIDGVNSLLLPGMEECVDIVAEEKAEVDASDVTAQIARLRDSNPDAIFVSSVGGNFEVLVQNTLAQQMPDTPRFSIASIGNQPDSWELANPGALEGLIFMSNLDPTNPKTQELEDFLKERRGDDYVITAYDAQGYDTVQLLKMAIEAAGSPDDGVAINDALESIEGYEAHFGQTGFTLSYGPDKHVGTDGLCGLTLVQFGADNTPEKPWDVYQPPC